MFSKKERILLFTLAAVQFSHIVDFMIMMPLGPQLMRIFNIDPHQFGLLVSSYTFTAGLAGFGASLMIDQFDRKTALLFFFVGFALGTLACALSPSYEILLLSRAITGCFGGVLNSIVLSIVGDQIPSERRGSAMGIIMAAFSAASVLGVPFSLYLANNWNWHSPFLFLGILALILCAAIYKFTESMTNHLKGPKERKSPFEPIIHVWNSPQQMLGLLFLFMLVFGQFSIIPFLSQSLVANAGLAESQLPLIYLFGGGVTIFSSPLIGRWADKFGKLQVFSVAVPISLIPVYLITNMTPQPVWFLLSICAFFFIVIGGRMIPAMAMIQGLVSPQFRGSYMSIVSSIQQLSAALASLVAGYIVTKDLQGHFLGYDRVGWISISFTCLALLVARRLKYK